MGAAGAACCPVEGCGERAGARIPGSCRVTDSEHRAQKRITNGITGLVWMVLAGVIVSTITAIAVAYGLIEKPF